jgi:hypothetical protein
VRAFDDEVRQCNGEPDGGGVVAALLTVSVCGTAEDVANTVPTAGLTVAPIWWPPGASVPRAGWSPIRWRP